MSSFKIAVSGFASRHLLTPTSPKEFVRVTELQFLTFLEFYLSALSSPPAKKQHIQKLDQIRPVPPGDTSRYLR